MLSTKIVKDIQYPCLMQVNETGTVVLMSSRNVGMVVWSTGCLFAHIGKQHNQWGENMSLYNDKVVLKND